MVTWKSKSNFAKNQAYLKFCPTFSKTKGNDKTFLKKRDNCHQDLKSIDHKKLTSLKEKSDMWK